MSKAIRPHRPITIPPEVQEHEGQPPDSLLSQKLDIALAVTSMFLEATKIVHAYPLANHDGDGEDFGIVARDLTPKEQSTYHASLDFLERYFDGPDACELREPG